MAGLVACGLYLFFVCNWFWHKSDEVYLILADTLESFGFCPKSGIPGRSWVKNIYMLKTSRNHAPEALLLARLTSYLILAPKGQGIPFTFVHSI